MVHRQIQISGDNVLLCSHPNDNRPSCPQQSLTVPTGLSLAGYSFFSKHQIENLNSYHISIELPLSTLYHAPTDNQTDVLLCSPQFLFQSSAFVIYQYLPSRLRYSSNVCVSLETDTFSYYLQTLFYGLMLLVAV